MKYEEVLKLEEKIYNMSNSFLPLDLFFNDIRDKFFEENFDKDEAYKDIEKIADFINNLQHENKVLKRALELACEKCNRNHIYFEEFDNDYFIDQAEKEVAKDES